MNVITDPGLVIIIPIQEIIICLQIQIIKLFSKSVIMEKILLFFVLISATLSVNSQTSHQSAISDSIAVWEVKKISHPLSLNPNQITRLEKAIKSSVDAIDNINKSNLDDSSKTFAIKERRKLLKRHLKSILTNEQYNDYVLIRKANRDNFIARQKAKKIKVNPLIVE